MARATRTAATWAALVAVLSGAGAIMADEAVPGLRAPAAGHVAIRPSFEMSGYADTDAVRVASPTLAVTVADDVAGWSVNARYLVDAVSAASVDIVSSASGKWSEYRHVGSAGVSWKAGSLGFVASGGVSREPDYLSIAGGGTVSLEVLDKNLTPFIGFSVGHDDVGRTGLPHEHWHSLETSGLKAGATFVVGRGTIASLSADAILERGYLAKPYRYVPLFATGVGQQLAPGASIAEVNRTRLDLRPADALPDERRRFAMSGRIAHRFEASTLRLDERLYRDSWGLVATTTDGRYILDVGRRMTLWPHVRVHAQRGVDFWRRAYEAVVDGGNLGVPTYRTGDRELGPLETLTAGAGARWRLGGEGSAPWFLGFQVDGVFTRYEDMLYLTARQAVFSTLSLEADLP
jgi:hypothetical protein